MKSNVLSIRLPEDKAEILQKMADSRGLKASDLMKEMVLAAIAGNQRGSGDNRLLLTKLEQVEANLIGAQSWLADVVMTGVKYAVEAKYQAEMGTQNTDEIISYLANKEPLAPKSKKQIITLRETEEAKRSANVARDLLPSQWSEK
ncbi:MAG: ribbon-helix-helix protein, CopG family [Candidatus Obscuribacterales bacterium]|nr:ribbon-helix-helix protein, CopG family [Candidatus Obscuribacterales bacterium]